VTDLSRTQADTVREALSKPEAHVGYRSGRDWVIGPDPAALAALDALVSRFRTLEGEHQAAATWLLHTPLRQATNRWEAKFWQAHAAAVSPSREEGEE